ncbi:hypothetical protein F5888DRAFT_639799 [Russula emetica]|nr:hypothetical protein F5888DRAFT_639799 [Russula emetica]
MSRSQRQVKEMVTAESLNFNVLQITFSHLSPPDLASVSQVSQVCQSFLAGALPRLYRLLGLSHNQSQKIVTPLSLSRHWHTQTWPAHVQNIGRPRCLRDSYPTSSTPRYTRDLQYSG